MIRMLAVVLPALLQAAAIAYLILANQGNGSFVGLGALLLGVPFLLFCIPINLHGVRRHGEAPGRAIGLAFATCFLLPVALLAGLWLVGFVITTLGLHK